MKDIKEFAKRIENDKAFLAKFKGITSEEKLFILAMAEGYNLKPSFNEKLKYT